MALELRGPQQPVQAAARLVLGDLGSALLPQRRNENSVVLLRGVVGDERRPHRPQPPEVVRGVELLPEHVGRGPLRRRPLEHLAEAREVVLVAGLR